MATRTLLSVEPDERTVASLRSTLAPYGFRVENIPNGEQAIEWARRNGPELIIVCVEPRKVGYAICNKLKRSPELQSIPLILTSDEETQQTFEQHKKLKSRADEYLLKPFGPNELLDRVASLINVGSPEASADLMVTADVSEEIAIGEGDIVEEDNSPFGTPVTVSKAELAADAARSPFGQGADVDAMFDQETDAAFAAIQTQDDSTGPMAVAPSAEPQSSNLPWEEDKTRATADLPEAMNGADAGSGLPIFDGYDATVEAESPKTAEYDAAALAEESGPVAVFAVEAPSEAHALLPPAAAAHAPAVEDHDVPPSPDEVMPAFHDAAGEARVAELLRKVEASEAERTRLEGELEELKLRLQSQPLSKEKEVLGLREIINRKEKDILDLRDSVDARDRQALDQKDRIRELERSRRDQDEKSLGIEKSLMAAQERTAALAHDKEKSVERERGLKARLEDALTEIQKAHNEVDVLKKRVAQSEERARVEVEKVRTELQNRLHEQEVNQAAEGARLSEERERAEATLKAEHEGELGRLKAAYAAELEALQKRSADDLGAAAERAQGELGKLRKEHEKALAAAKEEQSVQLAAERQAHQAAIENKERDHKNEILGQRRRQEEELRTAEERRQKELGDAEAKKIVELEAAETRRRQELQARSEEHHAQLTELDRRYFNEKTEMSERHRQELDQAHAQAARAEGELAARTEELSETRRRYAGTQTDLDTARSELRDREVRLGQARDRVNELEAKAAEYEDQILRAFQKLRADDKAIDKAKRALAVALSLLDERGAPAAMAPNTSAAPASVSAPIASPLAAGATPPPAATARPQNEESAT